MKRKNMTHLVHLALGSLMCASLPAMADKLSANDFMPPAAGGSAKVETKAVVAKKGVVKADELQSGLNFAENQLQSGGGVITVEVPSGFAVISTGVSAYKGFDNRNATLISKRNAYYSAYAKAKAQLIQGRDAFEQECASNAKEALAMVDTGKESAGNVASTASESCKREIRGMLSGYVIYDVRDDAKSKSIAVSIAASPKTARDIQREGDVVVNSGDVKKTFDLIAQEINQGVIPPVGARLITNKASGETIVVAFGSEVVRQNKSASVANALRQDALRRAQTRADSALIGFLQGDEVLWSNEFSDQTSDKETQFYDETDKKGNSKTKVYEQPRQEFLARSRSTDAYQTVTKGIVPAGVQRKSYVDDSGDWAIAVSILSQTLAAASKSATSGTRGSKSAGAAGAAQEKPRTHDLRTEGGYNDQADNPQRSSGNVSPDSSL